MKAIIQFFAALFITILSFSAPILHEESHSKSVVSYDHPDEIRYEYVIIDGVTWVYVYKNDILIATYEDEDD